MNRLSNDETKNLAILLVRKISSDISDDNYSLIDNVINILLDLPKNEVRFALKQFLSLELIVNKELDDHPLFIKLLLSIKEE